MKNHALCHHHNILLSSVLTIKKSSFATFILWSVRDSEYLKPWHVLHSHLC
jgi:hypothetical protein